MITDSKIEHDVATHECTADVQLSQAYMRCRLLKRFLDIFGSVFLLSLISPIFLIVICLIWYVDGAPIFYRRRVVGPNGEFDAHKFRSMVQNADALLAADSDLHARFARQFKLKDDPRVTRLGAWLRKYSLDELPQLLNVLKGQMSLVGPRMITPAELEKYGAYQQLVLRVKPGLTGLWQVRGRQEVSYEQRVEMDVKYLRDWSLALDLTILLETPLRVIRSNGAF